MTKPIQRCGWIPGIRRRRLSGRGERGLVWAIAVLGMASVQAHAQTEVVLHNFTGRTGYEAGAGVIPDPAGNLYGTAENGGQAGDGVVYKLDRDGRYSVLHSFTGRNLGRTPIGGVTRDPAGDLYGTTYYGGPDNTGVVYKLDTAGNYTVLYGFAGELNGSHPQAGVIRDSAGNLYGTTRGGGVPGTRCPTSTFGCGVVYKVDTTGQETVLYKFTGGADGGNPAAGVVRDSAGNLYGTTVYGGSANAGVVYKLDTAGNQTAIYTWTGGADGLYPNAVIRDPEGNLYGTTVFGGAADAGVVYKLDAAGNYTALYSFTGGSDGAQPVTGVIRDSAGNFYGTTTNDGATFGAVVYRLDTTGNYTVLCSFTGGADGGTPRAGVIRDSAGNLYGTNTVGGKNGEGVVYKIEPQ